MRWLTLLAATLGVSANNLIYPPGCSDSTKANYWSANPDSSVACINMATIYCPDSLANNYDASLGKPPPHPRRAACTRLVPRAACRPDA